VDPATSELAQVVTMATSIVGAVVYLQRAQMTALSKLAELLRPTHTEEIRDMREQVRRIDDKVDAIAIDVARITARIPTKRTTNPPKSPQPGQK